MRLMSPKQVTDDLKAQKTRALLEASEAGKQANGVIASLNEVKRMAAAERDRIKAETEAYLSALSGRKLELENEVAVLEKRRRSALRPIDAELARLKEARTAQDEAQADIVASLSLVESEKKGLEKSKQAQAASEKDLAGRERLVSSAEDRFSREKRRIMEALERRERKIEEREKRQSATDSEVQSQERVLKELKDEIDAIRSVNDIRARELDERERKLNHKEQIIANAFKEAKRKKII
jgi:hypothetical protein